MQDPEERELGSKAERKKTLTFGLKIKHTLRNIWADPATDVFDVGFVLLDDNIGFSLTK